MRTKIITFAAVAISVVTILIGTDLIQNALSQRSPKPGQDLPERGKPSTTATTQEPVLRQSNPVKTERTLEQKSSSQAPSASIENGMVCTTITFEGVGNESPIPVFDGISSPGWLGIIDQDAGGTGNFAFEPSPQTIAFWLGGAPGSRDILFDKPVAKVEFFYASFVTVQLDAFDEMGTIVKTSTGFANFDQGPGGDPTGTFNKWDPLQVEATGNKITKVRVSGNVNQTGIDNLKVCRAIGIHSVEVTQAIQEWQEIKEMEMDLQGDREPPVPIVKGKPAALRIYFNQLQAVTDVRVEVSGVTNQNRTVSLQPQCTPENYRRGENGCQSIDFYFIPPAGNWNASIKVFDVVSNTLLGQHDLPFASRDADDLVLRSVSICDAQDGSGNWECAQGSQLSGLVDFLRRTAPTDVVRVSTTNHFVRRNTNSYDLNGDGDGDDCFDIDGDGKLETCEVGDWWFDAIRDVHNLYGLFDGLLGFFGEQRYYYGLIRQNLPGVTGGKAHNIPSRGAGSRSNAIRLNVDVTDEVVAHETGHMLGRKHTNTNIPVAIGNSPPGCYNFAEDPSTDWPFADNRIQSIKRLEVGFDVSARRPILPEGHFDWMSYCSPRWISPHTYRNAMIALGATSATSARLELAAVPSDFWTVSGVIKNNAAIFDPLFTQFINAPSDPGTGSHRIEVRASDGAVVFTRFFTPSTVSSESGGTETAGPPVFFELIPLIAGANRIAVINANGTEIGSIQLGGAPPVVTINSPTQGSSLSGVAQVIWSITDSDSSAHTTKLLYSSDSGANWVSLGQVSQANTFPANFDLLPGSSGSSLIMVSVSDGVNTGNAISGQFSVPKKAPSAEITFPSSGAIFRQHDLVWFRGSAYDVDDGFLEGTSIRWESSRDGLLGTGTSLPRQLSVGGHTVTMTALDSNGNSASQSVSVQVAGATPTLDLTVTPLNTLPTTCVEVNINAQAGSVALSTVEYSLNGGSTWKAIPLTQLPFRFIVPGQGFFHFVARAIDVATQAAAEDARFFIDSPCQNSSPVLDCAVSANGQTKVKGTLNGAANSNFTIQFFSNSACSPTGRILVGQTTVTTDSSGIAIINAVLPVSIAAGQFVTASATDVNNNTSGLSECVTVTAPTLTINDVTVTEGDGGTSNAVFTVTLSGAQGACLPAFVNYSTSDGTAVAPGDYATTSGTLTFNPPFNSNSVTQTITVPVIGDISLEPDETFQVNLSSAVNASITDNQGSGAIVNNDQASLQYYPLPSPIRLLDTRPGENACFAPGVPLGNDAVVTQQAIGACSGIPANAKAVAGNATVVNFISSGFHWITLYPSDTGQPNASNLNFSGNQIVPNSFTVGLGADGGFKIYSHASTHFIVDITGYYAPPGQGGLYFHPLPAPLRLVDTRPGETACDTPGTPLATDGVRTVLAQRSCLGATIPSSAKAIVGNATVVNFISSGSHWITLYPFGAAQPNASNLNFTANQIVPNAFIVGLSNDGKFNIYSHASTHFIVDVAGYFSDQENDINGQGLLYKPLSAPVRLLDTRAGESGCDAPGVPLGNNATRTQLAQRTCFGVTIPSTAKAVVGNGTVVNFISSGFHWITLYPFGASQPNASNLNFIDNQIVPNAFVVGLSNDGKFNIYSHASTHFIVDLTGYFTP
jgi:hypothetical protein